MEVFGFGFFLLLFAAVGYLSSRRATDGERDYLLAERSVSPLLTALSAAATKYSGYMFIGLMGYIYLYGLSAVWLITGFLFGDLLAFGFVHQALRKAAEETDALSFASLLSRWNGGEYRVLRLAVGLLTLPFLATYAAAQLTAGGKAVQAVFEWPAFSGALIGAALILGYCLFGGLRASIWTDAAQSVVMMLAMLLLLSAAVADCGGLAEFVARLGAVSPEFLDLGVERFGSVRATALFAAGWLFNGIGVTGQPQVMVRFMALDRPENTRRTGLFYFGWSGIFLAACLGVGLASRLYIPDPTGFDAELALPTLAHALTPGLAVGVIVGGVFAASLSTTDSQVLSCAAVLSEDFRLGRGLRSKQAATFAVTATALAIAFYATANVFTLVIVAWSALAASLGPLVIVHALGGRPSEGTALAMMGTGLGVVFWWRSMGWNEQVYEGAPGILGPLILFGIVQAIGMTWGGPPSR